MKPGTDAFKGRVALPNPSMNKQVSFNRVAFKAVTETETVTFHTARIENEFGQPTFAVDKPETAISDKGHKVVLAVQNQGPRRQPKHVHPNVTVQVQFDASQVSEKGLADVPPAMVGEITDPPAAALGLSFFQLTLGNIGEGGDPVFVLPEIPIKKGPAGTFKFGPIPNFTLKITTMHGKITEQKIVVMPITSSTEPVQGGGGGGRGGPGSPGGAGQATRLQPPPP